MSKKIILIVIAIIIIAGLGYWIYQSTSEPETSEEFCIKIETGEKLSLTEAKQIALVSECGDRLKNTYMCNEDTGTWWIDLNIEKEGCNPACVINVATKEVQINWRCMGVLTCAKDGERFSTTDDGYPDRCCEGLKEWSPIPDTRFSIADVCYEIGQPSESNIGLCIKCGDGICESHPQYDENPCNCPEDCAGKNKSHFSSIEEFCQSNDWKMSLSKACEEQEPIKGSPICELCTP